jgi:hypothetical protein
VIPEGELKDAAERGKAWAKHDQEVAEAFQKLGPESGDTPNRAKDFQRSMKRLYNKRKQLLGV